MQEPTNPTNPTDNVKPTDPTQNPAPNPAPVPAPVPSNDNPFAGLEGEDLGFVQNKGWKTVKDMLSSYKNLENFRGIPEDELFRIPKNATNDDYTAIYKRLGAPEDYKEYGIQVSSEDDGPFLEEMLKAMQKAGLNKVQAKALSDTYDASLRQYIEKVNKQVEVRNAAQEQEIDAMWGKDAVLNRELCKKASRALGLTEEMNAQLQKAFGGPKAHYEFMFKVAQSMSEDIGKGFSSPGQGSFRLTPDQARARKASLLKDKEWVNRYYNGGASEREEMQNLDKIIVGVE